MNESDVTPQKALANDESILTLSTVLHSVGENIFLKSSLKEGQVVNVEIREINGFISPFSHEYPIDPAGDLKVPSLPKIRAGGNTLLSLREKINNSLVSNKILENPIVNVNLVLTKPISYGYIIKNGDTIFIRILERQGKINESSGKYTVNSDERLYFPIISAVIASGKKLFDLENEMEESIINSGFIQSPCVYISRYDQLL